MASLRGIALFLLIFHFHVVSLPMALGQNEEGERERERERKPEKVDRSWSSPITGGIELSAGSAGYSNLAIAGTAVSNRGWSFRLGGESLLFVETGKLGVGVGFSYLAHKVTLSEEISLAAFGLDVGLVYHLDFIRNQFLVPFVGLGLDTVTQQGRDAAGNLQSGSIQLSYGYQYKLGAQLLLDLLEPSAMKRADSELGVNHMYLLVEYVKASTSGGQANFSRDEIRGGVRFEF